MRLTGWIVATAVLLAAPALAASGDRVFRASNGVTIEAPEIGGLDCNGIELVVRRLDLSNYRGIAPLPEGHPDRPIFDYEDALARRQYFLCRSQVSRYLDPSDSFRHGFAH